MSAIVRDTESYKEDYVKKYLKSFKKRKHLLNCLEHERCARVYQRSSLSVLSTTLSQLPYQRYSDEELNGLITTLRQDIENAEKLIQMSEHGGLLRDLYINRLTWAQISMKWFMSEATISRTSRRVMRGLYGALVELGAMNEGTKVKDY